MQSATFTLQRSLSGKTLKAWRNAHNLSAHDLALELGVTRQYVKSIEGGSLEASQKFISKFNTLRARVGERTASEPQAKPVTIVSRFEMPTTIEILAKPRRCKGCRKFFIPVTHNQKMHNANRCKRLARKKRRRES